MRFHDFSLKCYGGFEKETLSFPHNSYDLHIIYGLNEAGKSTLLRAFRDFLFGFPKRTQGEDWKYSTGLIRVGASFSHADQYQTAWRRRPSPKRGDLFQEDDSTPLKSSLLSQAHDGLTADAFFRSWALDHQRLRKGGEAVASERQNAEQTSLARELGHIENISAIIDQLNDEKTRYWDLRKHNIIIKKLIKEYHEKKKTLRQGIVTPEKLKKAQDDVQRLKEAHFDVQSKQNNLSKESHLYAQLQALIPFYQKYQITKQRYSERPSVLFDRNDSATIISVIASKEEADRLCAQERTQLERYEGDLNTLGERSSLLDEVTTLAILAEEEKKYSQYETEYKERDERFIQLKQKRDSLLSRLDLNETTPLPSFAQLQPLSDLLKRYYDISARLKERHRDCATAHLPDPPPEAPDTRLRQSLTDWLHETRLYATLDTECDDIQRVVTTQKNTLNASLKALSPWSSDFENAYAALKQLSPPRQEECDEIISSLFHEQQRIDSATQKAQDALSEYEHQKLTYQELSQSSQWISEDTLTQARQKRDSLLKRIDIKTFIQEKDALYDLIQQTDTLADQRFSSSQTDARLRDIRARQKHLDLTIERAHHEEATARSALQRKNDRWAKRLQNAGLPILPPHQFSTWNAAREKLLEDYETYYAEREKQDQLEQKRRACIQKLHAFFPVAEDMSLNALLHKVQEHIRSLDNDVKHYDSLMHEHKRAQDAITMMKHKKTLTEHELSEWKDDWQKATQRIEGPHALAPEDLPLYQELIQTNEDFYYVSTEKQKREAQRYDRQRQRDQLLERYQAPSLTSLQAALAKAQRDEEQRRSLLEKRDNARSALIKQEKYSQSLAERLAVFLKKMPANSTRNDLQKRAQHDADTAHCLLAYEEATSSLLEAGHGRSLTDIITALEALNHEQLEDKKRHIESENAQLEDEKNALHKALLQAEDTLTTLTENDNASSLARDVQDLRARIEEASAHYVSLHTQYKLLQHMLHQQKEKLHGPFLTLASRFFSRLTLGDYQELLLEESDNDQLTFVGVRPGSYKTVPLKKMSEGTCDQLYLALRLADIHQQLDAGLSLPFFADDVFITFDDQRTRAGMELLADLSQRTQVFFFTHHRATLHHLPEHKAQVISLSTNAS